MTQPRSLRLLALLVAAVLLAACEPSTDQQPAASETRRVSDTAAVAGESAETPAISQSVYVADYSYVYHGGGESRFPLTTTLSVRNTDPERSITLRSVRYYNTEGELTRRFLEEPRRLGPLGTEDFVIEEHDVSGGTGANFIVEWSANRPVSRPVIESVMIGTRSNQGISFTSRGQPIEREP